MSECKHEKFEVGANVNRIEDLKRFQLEINVKCQDCKTPFRFLGLPNGIDFTGAARSPDGTEGRFAILPKDMPIPGNDDQPAGFRIVYKKGKNTER